MKQNLVIMPKRFRTWLAWCKNCSHFFELTAFYIWIDLCLTTKHLFEKLFSDFIFLLLLLLSNCPVIFFPEYGGPFKDIEKNLFIWLKRHSVIVYYFLVSSDFVVFLKIYILYISFQCSKGRHEMKLGKNNITIRYRRKALRHHFLSISCENCFASFMV